MTTIKTAELTGSTLDWVIAKCEAIRLGGNLFNAPGSIKFNKYSTDWAQGGPIIERERINSIYTDDQWEADLSDQCFGFGGSMLKAAMRCHVINNLGEEVEVPDELLEIA